MERIRQYIVKKILRMTDSSQKILNYIKIKDKPVHTHTLLFWCIFIFFSLLYLAIVIANHYFLRSYAHDYATFNNMFYDCGHLRANDNQLMTPPNTNILKLHFYFVMYFLFPLYWIFTPIFGTYSLLIIQWLFFLTSSYYTYRFILNYTKSYWLSITALFLSFVIIGKFSAMSADFNAATIGSLVVPIFLYYFDKKKYLWASFAFIFVISSKENLPIWFIFITLWLIIVYYKDKQQIRAAIYFLFSSLFAFILITKIITPLIYDPNYTSVLFEYSALGHDFKEALFFVFQYPEKVFALLIDNPTGDVSFNGVKAEFYYVILLSGGILLFYSPRHLIILVPIILQKMCHDSPARWGINWFYFIEISTILPIISVLIINNINSYRIKFLIMFLVLTSTTIITFEKLNRRSSPWYFPVKEKFYDTKMFKSDLNIKKIYKYLNIIPKDAKVSASERIAAHLSLRDDIYLFPEVRNAEYIFIIKNSSNYPISAQQINIEIDRYTNDNNNWHILVDDYPVIIFARVGVAMDIHQ